MMSEKTMMSRKTAKPGRTWNAKNALATGAGALAVVTLMATGQVVLAASAAVVTYLFAGPSRHPRREETER